MINTNLRIKTIILIEKLNKNTDLKNKLKLKTKIKENRNMVKKNGKNNI